MIEVPQGTRDSEDIKRGVDSPEVRMGIGIGACRYQSTLLRNVGRALMRYPRDGRRFVGSVICQLNLQDIHTPNLCLLGERI
jgi:hypothetical protein